MTDGIYHGHKTRADGTRSSLTSDEAEALFKAAEATRAERDAAMPTAKDALTTISSAQSRMNELGWRLGFGLRVSPGDECAVAQSGSTGMWRGRVDDDGEFVHFCDSVSRPRTCWLKPLADLNPEELAWMNECDRREAEAYSAMVDRMARLEE